VVHSLPIWSEHGPTPANWPTVLRRTRVTAGSANLEGLVSTRGLILQFTNRQKHGQKSHAILWQPSKKAWTPAAVWIASFRSRPSKRSYASAKDGSRAGICQIKGARTLDRFRLTSAGAGEWGIWALMPPTHNTDQAFRAAVRRHEGLLSTGCCLVNKFAETPVACQALVGPTSEYPSSGFCEAVG